MILVRWNALTGLNHFCFSQTQGAALGWYGAAPAGLKAKPILLRHSLVQPGVFGGRWPAFTPAIHRTYPLREVPEAMAYAAEGHVPGKIVIAVG